MCDSRTNVPFVDYLSKLVTVWRTSIYNNPSIHPSIPSLFCLFHHLPVSPLPPPLSSTSTSPPSHRLSPPLLPPRRSQRMAAYTDSGSARGFCLLKRCFSLDRPPAYCRATQRQTTIHTHTYSQFRQSNSPSKYVYGLCKETGVPGGNPRMHRENKEELRFEPWTSLK